MSSQSYSLWQPLGEGVHSVVWRARKIMDDSTAPTAASTTLADNLSLWVAVKIVQDNKTMPPHDIQREAAILKMVSHPNIISFNGFTQGDPNAPFALYMPLIPLPLTALLSSPWFTSRPLTGPYSALTRPVFASHTSPDGVGPFVMVAKSLIYQIISAITYLHSLDPPVAHRDINPSNVLIDCEGMVKLIDFGIAWSTRHLHSIQSNSSAGFTGRYPSDGWTETEGKMCCEVATGPYRAPELLFSPRTYSAAATDLWSLGTTIAQFFTPLRLVPSPSSVSSSQEHSEEEEQSFSEPFLISPSLSAKIDYRAKWERLTLFDGSRGELGLAWSIFKLRGTPNEETWPDFNSLPDANKLEFHAADRQPLHTVLPHLPSSRLLNVGANRPSIVNVDPHDSPLSLIDALLAYPPSSRLAATDSLMHPWFSVDVILPLTYPSLGGSVQEPSVPHQNKWSGRSLGEWLEPILKGQTTWLANSR